MPDSEPARLENPSTGTPKSLATGQSICAWVAKADKQEGRREATLPGLATAERDELVRLRRELRQLRLEREIL